MKDADKIESILEAMDDDLPMIQEPQFKRDFLPLFTGELEDDVEAVAAWISGVAGSSTSPTKVMGSEGEILFIVPPILDTSIATIEHPEAFETITGMYQMNSGNRPQESRAQLDEDLHASKSEVSFTINKGWTDMYKYYDIPMEGDKDTTETPKKPSVIDDLGL